MTGGEIALLWVCLGWLLFVLVFGAAMPSKNEPDPDRNER